MMIVTADRFDDWREKARRLLSHAIEPSAVHWRTPNEVRSLFDEDDLPTASPLQATVPKAFIELAEQVACHCSADRWALLYTALWRLTHGEANLLEITTDEVIHPLRIMEQAIRRDIHKLHAFVRFRKCSLDEENYVAWYRPDHRVLRHAVGLFEKRFRSMKWAILTPDESVHWDGEQLHWGPAASPESVPQSDTTEDYWKAYYRAIFNPARVKVKAMKKELPVRFWDLLPEAELIHKMLRDAPKRVQAMLEEQQKNVHDEPRS